MDLPRLDLQMAKLVQHHAFRAGVAQGRIADRMTVCAGYEVAAVRVAVYGSGRFSTLQACFVSRDHRGVRPNVQLVWRDPVP
jgi:hypothetical protein